MFASTRARNLLLPALFLLIVAAVACFQGLSSGQNTSLMKPAATQPIGISEYRGISLQVQNPDPNHPYEPLIDEIAATGANTINMVVTGWQENCSSTSIFIDARRGPTPRRMVEIMRYAKRKGLRVVLMPIVLLENGREGEWRGKISPSDHWWENYNNYVLHYAYLAQEAKIDVLMVGSELVYTEKQTDRWKALIAEVRKAFPPPGRLSYSANWDHYTPIEWWDDLDIVGMTTYYDLSGGKKPTMDVLLDSWRKIRKDILDWQAKIKRPILFTEVGWPNQVTCAQYPWDYYRSTDQPDPQAQANCFEAFFRTWANEPQTAGWLVWEWRTGLEQKPDEKDTSYNPAGKPAMAVIKKYFNHNKVAGAVGKESPTSEPVPAATTEGSEEEKPSQATQEMDE